jgi:hypothetical protein
LFIDSKGGDYRLQAASPAIDRGTNDLLAQLPPSDLAGRVRLWDGDDIPGAIIDLGAYEYGAGPLGIEYGDIDESGKFEYYEPFLFSLYWQEENNETSYRFNPVPGERVDASDLLFLLGEWK